MSYSIQADRGKKRIIIQNDLSEVLVSWPCEEYRPSAYPCTQHCRLADFCSDSLIFSESNYMEELCNEMREIYFDSSSPTQARTFINSLKGKIIKKIARR